jgi:hypothetical protein
MVNAIGCPNASLKESNLIVDDASSTMNPAAASPLHPVHTTPAPAPDSQAVRVGTFCHYCCDQTDSAKAHECVNCGAIVCEQYLPRSSGCIFLRSVEVPEKDFLCPLCSRSADGKDKPLRYAFIGFGRRKKVKMAWPMAIVNLNLESMKDDYLSNTVTLEAKNHYRSFQDNVSTINITSNRVSNVLNVDLAVVHIHVAYACRCSCVRVEKTLSRCRFHATQLASRFPPQHVSRRGHAFRRVHWYAAAYGRALRRHKHHDYRDLDRLSWHSVFASYAAVFRRCEERQDRQENRSWESTLVRSYSSCKGWLAGRPDGELWPCHPGQPPLRSGESSGRKVGSLGYKSCSD